MRDPWTKTDDTKKRGRRRMISIPGTVLLMIAGTCFAAAYAKSANAASYQQRSENRQLSTDLRYVAEDIADQQQLHAETWTQLGILPVLFGLLLCLRRLILFARSQNQRVTPARSTCWATEPQPSNQNLKAKYGM